MMSQHFPTTLCVWQAVCVWVETCFRWEVFCLRLGFFDLVHWLCVCVYLWCLVCIKWVKNVACQSIHCCFPLSSLSAGPMKRTVNDYWRMLWEQKVFVVVMTTKWVGGILWLAAKVIKRCLVSTLVCVLVNAQHPIVDFVLVNKPVDDARFQEYLFLAWCQMHSLLCPCSLHNSDVHTLRRCHH